MQGKREKPCGRDTNRRGTQGAGQGTVHGGMSESSSSSSVDSSSRVSREALRAEHRFVRTDDADACGDLAGVPAARRAAILADRALYKEYAVADVRAARAGGHALGLRWRTRAEVLAGKGTAVCAALDCAGTRGLRSYEVDFRYREAGAAQRTLVKVRLCRACARAVGWRHHKHSRHRHKHHHHNRSPSQYEGTGDEEETVAAAAAATVVVKTEHASD